MKEKEASVSAVRDYIQDPGCGIDPPGPLLRGYWNPNRERWWGARRFFVKRILGGFYLQILALCIADV